MPDGEQRLDDETGRLILLALNMAAEAAEVCDWFTMDFEPISELRAAADAFATAYGPWYEDRHYGYDVGLHNA